MGAVNYIPWLKSSSSSLNQPTATQGREITQLRQLRTASIPLVFPKDGAAFPGVALDVTEPVAAACLYNA